MRYMAWALNSERQSHGLDEATTVESKNYLYVELKSTKFSSPESYERHDPVSHIKNCYGS